MPAGRRATITLSGQGGFGDLLGTGRPQFVQSGTGLESILLALDQAGRPRRGRFLAATRL